ncbi:MAG: hypothetical protein H6622_15200 [Halobacteriovoraceae bacterium]|nr:hypothetical protein [Halobacteriovoraceae bacterium]
MEEKLLKKYKLFEYRSEIALLIRKSFKYRHFFTSKKITEIRNWDIAVGKIPTIPDGVYRERIDLTPGFKVNVGQFGILTIIKSLGYGFEHSVFLTTDKDGKEHVLKIAHYPEDDSIKKTEYKSLLNTHVPTVKIEVAAKGFYIVERVNYTAAQILKNYIKTNEGKDNVFEIIHFYKKYLDQNQIIKDLTFDNIGEDLNGQWKIIDWFGVIDETRIKYNQTLKKLQKLELSMKLSNSFELLEYELIHEEHLAGEDIQRRFTDLKQIFKEELDLTDVKNSDEFLHSGLRSIVSKSSTDSTL